MSRAARQMFVVLLVTAGGGLLYAGHYLSPGPVLDSNWGLAGMVLLMAAAALVYASSGTAHTGPAARTASTTATRSGSSGVGSGVDLAADVGAVGADRFLADCVLVAGPVPDPGHPGGMPLALWEPPAPYVGLLVLECFNGTPGPDGRYERLAKGVPGVHRDPVAAAAASYGVDPSVYAALATRT